MNTQKSLLHVVSDSINDSILFLLFLLLALRNCESALEFRSQFSVNLIGSDQCPMV